MKAIDIEIIHLSANVLYMIDEIIQNEDANTEERLKFDQLLAEYDGEELKAHILKEYAWTFPELDDDIGVYDDGGAYDEGDVEAD